MLPSRLMTRLTNACGSRYIVLRSGFKSLLKNKRLPYCEWSQEEKDKKKIKTERSGSLKIKKKQAEEELVPVLVQQHEGSEKFPAFTTHGKVESDQH